MLVSEFYFIKARAKFTSYGVLSDSQPMVFISFTCSFTFTGHFFNEQFCDALSCGSPQNLTQTGEGKKTDNGL
jgi:hypothetical protein